jgi:hypothetical protein
VKRGGSLSFLVGTNSNVLVMAIGWTDVARDTGNIGHKTRNEEKQKKKKKM